MRILFLPKYHNEGPSSRYRTYNYIEYFKKSGHDVEVKPLFHDGYVKNFYLGNKRLTINIIHDYFKRAKYLIKHKKKFDLIIIEKELFPFIPYYFEKILLNKVNYTLDFDDAISVKYKKSLIIKMFFGEKINHLSEKAKLTTVGNHWYWNEITKGNLRYLPTVIDVNKYAVDRINSIKNEKPIIVWVGSPATVKYINIIKNILVRLSKKYEFKLRVIGAKISIDSIEVECFPWSEEKEFIYLKESDIGIMPLYESTWESGKCGLKLIQYMAAKLPVVASKSPANEEIVIHNETGYIANNNNDWYIYLETLIKDQLIRKKFGEKGRLRIEKHYTYQVWANRYIKMIEDSSICN